MTPSPTPSPFVEPPPPGLGVLELVVGVLLALIGVWSAIRWMRKEFVAESWRDRVLYVLHISARAGVWFGFAAFFFGLAVVDDPSSFTWLVIIPVGLAGLQLVTAVALGRTGGPTRPRVLR